MKAVTVRDRRQEYLVDAHQRHRIDEEMNMITLTVIVASLGLGLALTRAWNWAAVAIADRTEVAPAGARRTA